MLAENSAFKNIRIKCGKGGVVCTYPCRFVIFDYKALTLYGIIKYRETL